MIRHKLIGTVAYMGGTMALPEAFAWAWGQLTRHTEAAICGQHEHIHLARSTVSLHDWGRNQIVSDLQGEWLFMLDNDLGFEPDLCARMVAIADRYGLDVVTGIYSYKSPPHYPVLYLYNHESGQNEIIAEWDRNCEVFRVDSAGAGCLFVRRSVFERIARELKVNPFDRLGRKGEDHSFFERLRELGIPAWCAWNIEVQHLAVLGLQTSVHFKPTREPDHYYDGQGFDRAGAGVKASPFLGEKEQLV